MENNSANQKTIDVIITMREFAVPPISDALVLGKDSPIGCEAMRNALSLLHVSPFEHIEFEDDVISDILIRSSIVRKVPRDRIIEIVKDHCKPCMEPDEVIHIKFTIESHVQCRIED